MNSNIQKDLEELTNCVFRGDITPILYNLVKDSPYKEDCLEYLGIAKQKKTVEEIVQPQPAQDFRDWFNSFKEVK